MAGSIKRIPCSPTTRHSNREHCDPGCGSGASSLPATGHTLLITELVRQAHETALAKGWWDAYLPPGPGTWPDTTPDRTRAPNVPPDSLAAKIMLIVTECAEALECVRDGQIYAFRDTATDKPEGLPFELADVVIRVADLCGALGIDLDAAVREKLEYNRTRTHRHGGRAL
jgi:NTP pyrophosphatase (non-canonical NTP hydrolase)